MAGHECNFAVLFARIHIRRMMKYDSCYDILPYLDSSCIPLFPLPLNLGPCSTCMFLSAVTSLPKLLRTGSSQATSACISSHRDERHVLSNSLTFWSTIRFLWPGLWCLLGSASEARPTRKTAFLSAEQWCLHMAISFGCGILVQRC